MPSHVSDPRSRVGAVRRSLRRISNERGAVLVFVAVGIVALLGVAGVAIDSGRGFITRARLVRALDSAVLTGARTLRSGQTVARQQAFAAAAANGYVPGQDGAALNLTFSTNEEGEQTVRMTAQQDLPTILLKLVGVNEFLIGASATAAVPPVDLVLVIDQSGSLGQVGAWDDLQDAAKAFVDYFDNNIDKMGLVSFSTRGTERFFVAHNFRTAIKNRINAMSSVGWTNYDEGLRLAHVQITSAAVRPRSAKVVVFFTDGRPNAFRGQIGTQNRIIAAQQTSPLNRLGGYYNNPDGLPSDSNPPYSGCENVVNCAAWTQQPTPPIHSISVDNISHQRGLSRANDIRAAGAYLYTIGLGDPNANQTFVPNHAFMRQLANEGGVTNPNQKFGRYYFAPDANALEAVFNQVAQDLLVRLAH